MAKSLTLAAAAFLLFLVAAEATIRTTVIIDEDFSNQRGKGGQGQGRECREQIQQQDNLRHCQQHLIQQAQRQGGRGRRDEFAIFNPTGQEHFEDCCEELRQLDRECTCQGLQQAIEQIPRGQMREQDRQTVRQIAENLPGQCRTEPTRCQFGGRQPAWF